MKTLYNVSVRRNLNWPDGNNFTSITFNDRPITFEAAVKFSDSLRKSGIPSININTIEIIESDKNAYRGDAWKIARIAHPIKSN